MLPLLLLTPQCNFHLGGHRRPRCCCCGCCCCCPLVGVPSQDSAQLVQAGHADPDKAQTRLRPALLPNRELQQYTVWRTREGHRAHSAAKRQQEGAKRTNFRGAAGQEDTRRTREGQALNQKILYKKRKPATHDPTIATTPRPNRFNPSHPEPQPPKFCIMNSLITVMCT